ncbi:MAG: ribose-phosphate pyrophosphokinase [Clostridiales Family XIII bacterium]|nr:ribose-phosphate pyrophosphokinase [Clostridiales Family XIII bacterium]
MNNAPEYKIFTGNSNKKLADEIASEIGKPLGRVVIDRFKDGEISVSIFETVRGKDVYLIQSTSEPVNENLMELLILIDAMKRASANKINAVIPYFGYARQDRKAKARDPITAKLVANLLTAAGADRVVTMDLHADQIQGFFDIPIDNLQGLPILIKYFKRKKIKDLVVVSPDHGSVKRARAMALPFEAPIAIIDKRRPKANAVEIMNVVGEIKGKNCILVDDMIDTAGTITAAANQLIKMGAKDVYACASHGVLSGPAIKSIKKCAIKEMVLLDTIQIPEKKLIDKITVLSVARLFSDAMTNILNNESVSKLFV